MTTNSSTPNTSKLNILIVDDKPSDIDLIEELINYAGIANYVNIHKFFWIQNIPDTELNNITLKQFIDESNVHIDIAMIDLYFENEFAGKDREAGGVYAATMIKKAFPDCPIIFSTYNMDRVVDGGILSKFEAEYWRKGNSTELLEVGKNRIISAIKKWMKFILFEISTNEFSKKQCLEAIQNGTINWNATITINKENWTFENLFFIYKNQPKEKINDLIKKHLVRFPQIKKRKDVDRWNQAKGLYKSPLKDYYSLLYIDYYSDLAEITNKATSFLDKLLELLLLYLKASNDSKLKDLRNNLLAQAESICDIRADVRKISANKYIAFQDFKKKLVVRLICITSYCCFKMSVVSILYLFTKSDYLQNNNVKMISNFLFIYGMCYDEQQSDFEKFLHECSKHRDIKNLTTYEPADREYNKILGTPEQTGSCSDYELDFISSYFNEMKTQIQNKEEAVKSYFSDTFKVLEEANVLKQRYN
ncbi:hypothetical protein FACS1894145_0320 [Bacteroidia bacterium]|nr:hypothetical protein FACS1894145_0320 [Bacteroidia bacterium]